jgi:hypothetical protein
MKRFRLSITCAVLTSLLSVSLGNAQYHAGGRGLMYVHSARTLSKGNLHSYFHSRFFGDIGKFQPQYFLNAYWNVQASFALNYGLTNRFELSLLPIVYQDTNRGEKGYNLPDDLFLKLKFGSIGSPGSRLKYGALLSTRLPLGGTHNVVLEPYSAGTLEIGIAGLASYAKDALFPDESLNFHLNLGFLSHNDAGETLTELSSDTLSNTGISSEFTYGLGLRYPFERLGLALELNGNYFIKQPAPTAYSRENYLYLTPGLSYRISPRWQFDLAVDVRLASDSDETEFGFIDPTPEEMPGSYSGWRVNLGLKYEIIPSLLHRIYDNELANGKVVTRRDLFEQLVREMQENDNSEKELKKVAAERLKGEKEAGRLRVAGDGKKKEKKP